MSIENFLGLIPWLWLGLGLCILLLLFVSLLLFHADMERRAYNFFQIHPLVRGLPLGNELLHQAVETSVFATIQLFCRRGIWLLSRIDERGVKTAAARRHFTLCAKYTLMDEGRLVYPARLEWKPLPSGPIADPSLKVEWNDFARDWRTLRIMLHWVPLR